MSLKILFMGTPEFAVPVLKSLSESEHKILSVGVILNLFSFDQFGVELGKKLANDILKDIKQKSIISETELNEQVLEAYKDGLKSLNEGDVLFAAKKFNEVEILYPLSVWAPKSSLMGLTANLLKSFRPASKKGSKILPRLFPWYGHYSSISRLCLLVS